MDSLPTTPMLTQFNYDNIRVLHIEPTTTCNAACPQCARMNPELYVHEQHASELRLNQVQQLVPDQLIRQLDKMFMCGNFGDPAAAKDTLQIYQYFRAVNSKIVLGMNTNGGLRTKYWWQELANNMKNELDYVVFSIDGLEDTNHIYRAGVQWDIVMANAEAYIAAGGTAHWDMLIYKHNQHQVDACRELARAMGFTRFRTKVSSRFQERPIEWLRPPQGYTEPSAGNTISCHALKEQSIYITATGAVLPCCFFGSDIFSTHMPWNNPVLREQIESFNSIVTEPDAVCKRHCSVAQDKTAFQQQWKSEEALC